MKKQEKDYTPEETAKFKAERNQKTRDEKYRKQHPEMVFLAKRDMDTILKFGLSTKGKTFVGSVRNQFTGARRNNQVSNF